MNKNNHGFTLIELMVTLAVLGTIIAIAAPSFSAFTNSSRRASQVNIFSGALSYARSEAIKRNSTISVCARTSGAETCSGANTWANGMLIFDDTNNDGVYAPITETLLRIFDPLTGNSTITKVNPPWTITYRGSGFASAAAEFKYCSGTNRPTDARAIIVSKTGRSRLSIDTDADKIHEDSAGNNLVCP